MRGCYLGEDAIAFARRLYLSDQEDHEEFEAKVWYILHGGTLDGFGGRAGYGGPLDLEPMFQLPRMDYGGQMTWSESVIPRPVEHVHVSQSKMDYFIHDQWYITLVDRVLLLTCSSVFAFVFGYIIVKALLL